MLNDDELLRLIDDVAAQSNQNADRAAIEAWIDQVVAEIARRTRHTMRDQLGYSGTDPAISDRMRVWVDRRSVPIAEQVAAVARVLLRRELLGEG